VNGAVGALLVAGREAARHDLVEEEVAVLEPERLEQQLLDRPLVGPARHLLDDPAGERQRRVVVGHRGPRRELLLDAGHPLDVLREGVVPVTGVVIRSPCQPAVWLRRCSRVTELATASSLSRNSGTYRRVQLQLAPLDQSQKRGRGVGLAGRSELEQRAVIHRQGVLDAGHPWKQYCSCPAW
jgi:hypothetical protein